MLVVGTFLIAWQFVFCVSDSAIGVLLTFIKKLLLSINDDARKLSDVIPNTYDSLVKSVGVGSQNNIIQYVVCRKCDSIYDHGSCFSVHCGKKESKNCKFVAFPDHPQISRRKPCDVPLMKEIKCSNMVEVNIVPHKIYPYCSIKGAITRLISTPGFLEKCDHWRKRSEAIPLDMLADIYNGAVWKDFNSTKYNNFLQYPGNLLLSLNFDFFQPFKRTQYSIRALYLVILNLPR